MRQRLLTATAALLLCCGLRAALPATLDSLYRVLDEAIDSSAVYVQQKTARLQTLKADLRRAATDSLRYCCAKRLYEEYIPFENDSAIAYQYICMDLARQLGRDDLFDETLIALADQLTESGFYHEAQMQFSRMTPPGDVGSPLWQAYQKGIAHLYGEMGFYSHDPRLRQEFFARSGALNGELLASLDTTSAEWLLQRTIDRLNQQQWQQAMDYSRRWEQACEPQSRQWAVMAYYRSVIYGQQGDIGEQRRWLAQSALVDIRNAIMDQGALWSLAETLISEEEELDRAHRYIDFSWQCLQRFSTHMRSWLVAPVVTRINDEYKQQLRSANRQQRWALGLISLLVVGLLASLIYVQKKRRQLALARNELKGANEELALLNQQLVGKNAELQQRGDLLQDANRQLNDTNEQLRLAVMHMNDSNRVKDEYLGKFFNICSDYIDKLDNYRLKVNRKLKAKLYNDLMRMTSSEQLKEDEVKELFDNFDSAFLHLFPTFVDDFNALLRPEERISLPSRNHLNTDLRIFALIRLGIDESSKIAEFLRYSPNSIYAYRARIKNKAAGNRADFERQVKEIGIRG